MKKFAIMLLNPQFEPEKHTACFKTENVKNYVITVRNEQEAIEKAAELAKANFGVLEVCGAFGEELVQKMYEAAGGRLCIGYVVYPPEQLKAVEKYWMDTD